MSMCTVNGVEYEVETVFESWGQLLLNLEGGAPSDRSVVTAVRFGGVDQPSFRASPILEASLASLAPVDVETVAARELVDSAVQAIVDGVGPLVVAARRTAGSFRLHDLARAHRELVDFVATFQVLTNLTAAIGQFRAIDGGLPPEGGDTDVLKQLHGSLESLTTFDINEDWISVADVLEHEIADTLSRWPESVL